MVDIMVIDKQESDRLKKLTNQNAQRGYETTNVLFKKIKDTEDHRVKFIGINKQSGEVQSILNFKQFSAFAKMYRHNKSIQKYRKNMDIQDRKLKTNTKKD